MENAEIKAMVAREQLAIKYITEQFYSLPECMVGVRSELLNQAIAAQLGEDFINQLKKDL